MGHILFELYNLTTGYEYGQLYKEIVEQNCTKDEY